MGLLLCEVLAEKKDESIIQDKQSMKNEIVFKCAMIYYTNCFGRDCKKIFQ